MEGEAAIDKMRRSICHVCGGDVFVDEYGNGDECPRCGWRQSDESFLNPNIAGIRNIPSLNSARKQYAQGGSAVLANFNDFVSTLSSYGEVEFTYKNVRFGVLFDDESKRLMLINIKTNQKQFYTDLNDFANNAALDGTKLSELWGGVTNTDFLQGTEI